MNDMIEVEPSPEQRRAFAQWAVAQTPKLSTIGPNTFAVPADLFTAAPEEILIGSRVDGRRYTSPDEDAQAGQLLGVATAEGLAAPQVEMRTAEPAAPLPELAPAAYDPDSVPLDVPGSASSDPQPEEAAESTYACDLCSRAYPTERGRDTHRRRAHPEG